MKFLASVLSVSLLAIVGCAGADATLDDSTEDLKQACGGIAAIQCPTGYECVIKATYPDAMGTCKKQKACVETQMCTLSSHWDSKACACVPDSCVEQAMCIQGMHFDSTLCKCVAD